MNLPENAAAGLLKKLEAEMWNCYNWELEKFNRNINVLKEHNNFTNELFLHLKVCRIIS